MACKKAHKIRPGQLYVARSVFIRPPKYPIQLSYCASASKKYAALPSTQERALARMAGVKIPDEPPKFQRAGIKVTDFEQMCETHARSYRFMKRTIWESLKRWKEAHAAER